MARPWIIGGLSLALMETLADFGTVSVLFNFDTFTTAIYKAWFFVLLPARAAGWASLLVIGVFGLVLAGTTCARPARLCPAPASTAAAHPAAWQTRTAGHHRSRTGPAAGLWRADALLVWALSVMETDLDARYFGFVGNAPCCWPC